MNQDNTERTIMGLLRLVGWQSGRDRELTQEEADSILEVAATQPVSDDARARLRERVMASLEKPTSPAPSPTELPPIEGLIDDVVQKAIAWKQSPRTEATSWQAQEFLAARTALREAFEKQDGHAAALHVIIAALRSEVKRLTKIQIADDGEIRRLRARLQQEALTPKEAEILWNLGFPWLKNNAVEGDEQLLAKLRRISGGSLEETEK